MTDTRGITGIRARLGHLPATTMILVGTGIGSRLITLMTQIVIAYQFGLSMASDAYFAVENVPELFMEFVGIGFSMAFIPLFAEYRLAQSEGEAARFANAFLLLTTAVSLVFALLVAIAAPLLVTLMAPGFAGEARELAITLVRIMALSLILLGLEAGTRGILQSNQVFVVPEIGRILYNLSLFGAAWLFGDRLGVVVLAWGMVVGALVHLLIQLFWIWRKRMFRFRLVWYHPGTGRVLRQLLPFFIAISSVNILLLIDRMVASGLSAGSIAALTFATRLILLPIGIFVIPLRTAIYPTIANLAVERQSGEIAQQTTQGLRLLLFIVVPACVGLTMLRMPLTALIFERGAFDSAATMATSDALLFYALGVPAIAVIFFASGIFFALGYAGSLMRLTLVIWLLNAGLSWLLSSLLGSRGVALATTLACSVMALLMLAMLKRSYLPMIELPALAGSLIKITAAAALMGLALSGLAPLTGYLLSHLAFDYRLAQVALLSLAGLLVYLLAAYLLKSDEMRLVTAKSRGLLQF